MKSSEDNENIEVCVRNENGQGDRSRDAGQPDPREFTVANIVGNVDLDSLADLGGQFGSQHRHPQDAHGAEEKGVTRQFTFVATASISNFRDGTGSSNEATTVGLPGITAVSISTLI